LKILKEFISVFVLDFGLFGPKERLGLERLAAAYRGTHRVYLHLIPIGPVG
jgi:hypothetical protein